MLEEEERRRPVDLRDRFSESDMQRGRRRRRFSGEDTTALGSPLINRHASSAGAAEARGDAILRAGNEQQDAQ